MVRNITLSTLFALLSFGGLARAEGGASGPGEAVRAFVKAGDTQDVGAAEALMHAEFRVAFVVGDADAASLVDRASYLDLLGAKKIGGDTRQVKIESVRRTGPLASVEVRLIGSKGVFSGTFTLLEQDGRWSVYQDATHMQPK